MKNRIKAVLVDIANKTYGDNIQPFKIEVFAEERKSCHGDYCPSTKSIRIFNVSRPIDHIISTTIHELAHHVDCCLNGSSGHNKRFYGILRDLLKTAIECGYVDYSSIKSKKDSTDIIMMEKYYGELVAFYDESKDSHKDECILKVLKSYNIKDYLKQKKYSYNSIEKIWEKTIEKNDIETEKAEILKQDPSVEFIVNDYNDMTMNVYYYIIVSKNTYEHKDALQQNGYKYKGYGVTTNSWVKKIKTTELSNEKKFLSGLNLDYKIKN